MELRTYFLVSVALLSSGCQYNPPEDLGSNLQISVAPLSLPGLSKVCYDLKTTNDSAGGGDTVWQRGNPLLKGGDSDAICSSTYGDGAGGDITFVGSCDASPASVGASGRTNSVTIWVDSLYDAGGTLISPSGPNGWRDPCPSGCTLDTVCQENTDASVTFNLSILREANQGFFDIGVNFQDIFCSAKVDCRDQNNQPLDLLFRPGTSTRDTTIVAAFACTAGPGSNTHLYRNPLVISCGSIGSSVTLDPHTGKGNAWATDPNANDAVWQYAVYADEENLTCGSNSCRKLYWNVAFGLSEVATNCRLQTSMTASDGPLNDFKTPPATTYPFISVDVELTGASGLSCNKHPVNVVGSGVETDYTSISLPQAFLYEFDGTNLSAASTSAPSSIAPPSDPDAGNVVLLMHFDAPNGTQNFLDVTGRPVTATSGVTHSTTRSKFGGSSAYFNGTSGYLAIPYSQAWNFGTEAFTAEMFVSALDMSGSCTAGTLLTQGPGGGAGSAFWFGLCGNGGQPAVYGAINSTGWTHSNVSATSIENNGLWHHLAWVREAGSGTMKAYLDGNLTASVTIGTGATALNTSTLPLLIGAQSNPATFFKGYIDELRVTKGIARYTSNFTPPTAAFPDVPTTCTPFSQTFSHTGSSQSFTVPSGCSKLTVKAWGAGGGGGGAALGGLYSSSAGGAGGFSVATLSVTSGEALNVVVGGRGSVGLAGATANGGFGGGGSTCGAAISGETWPGGGAGGGLSGIFRGVSSQANALLVAGGGGGGLSSNGNTAPGGAGGGTAGIAGSWLVSGQGGGGGSQIAGGSAGLNGGNAGSALTGGNGYQCWIGGAGGGGYFGGGGGGWTSGKGGGGGGGSGFIPLGGLSIAGSGRSPPLSEDLVYASGAGTGGTAYNSGAHGLIVISWP